MKNYVSLLGCISKPISYIYLFSLISVLKNKIIQNLLNLKNQ